jgi:beta-glucosidase
VAEKAQSIAAAEARAVGIHWSFAPMLDIARDPRWGRIVESPGEDPFLASAMARAFVRGFQGDKIGAPDRVLACAKHFAAYGAAEGGRDYDAAHVPDTDLWNVYLPPFEAAVKAGSACVMAAYMDLNDVPATGNRFLLHDVLREAWGFRGFVVSDANSVDSLKKHGFARDEADAALRAFKAGVNMEMSFGPGDYPKTLPAAVKAGRITAKELDDAVRPLLVAKARLGLFENPYVDEAKAESVLGTPAHRDAAREAAERSAVLLRNEGGLLPLQRGKKIALVGPLADSAHDLLGSWTFHFDLKETPSLFSALRAKLGDAAVTYAPGVQIKRTTPTIFDLVSGYRTPDPWSDAQAKDEWQKALDAARAADVVVMALGEQQNMSGEMASRASLSLPGRQQELLEAVAALGKPVVLVLVNGRPLDIAWASSNVPAILEAWYPGTRGGEAIANLLLGDAVPGGKLPVSWPRDVSHVPFYYSHNLTQDIENHGKRYWDVPSTPLFPFGHGLSYTTFAVSNLAVAQPELAVSALEKGQAIDVSADVENTGGRAGDQVVQLYVHQKAGSASRPVRQLKGFSRVSLKPGEKQTVRFKLGAAELRYWSGSERRFVLEGEAFHVWVGGDSTASLAGSFRLLPN